MQPYEPLPLPFRPPSLCPLCSQVAGITFGTQEADALRRLLAPWPEVERHWACGACGVARPSLPPACCLQFGNLPAGAWAPATSRRTGSRLQGNICKDRLWEVGNTQGLEAACQRCQIGQRVG